MKYEIKRTEKEIKECTFSPESKELKYFIIIFHFYFELEK